MKKILFLLYDYYPNPSANTLCVDKIIEDLKMNGSEIFIVSVKSDRNLKTCEMVNGHSVYRITNQSDLISRYAKKNRNRYIKKILYKILAWSTKNTFEGYPSKWNTQKVTNKILKMNKKEKFDSMISVSLPYITSEIAMHVKNKLPHIKWIVYELDPFSYNYTLSPNMLNERKALEEKVCKNADLIISTLEITRENHRQNFRTEFESKTKSVPLPNLVNNINTSRNIFDSKHINLVYTGFFYSKIRSPEILLKMMVQLIEINPQIVLHIYGGGCDTMLKKYKESLGDNLVLYGNVSKDKCSIALQSADILINIGNKVINQTPSKLFEYIGTGKPIINFTYQDYDTSQYYLDKYPSSISVSNLQLNESTINNVYKFIESERGRNIPFSSIEENMKELLSSSVVRQINQYIVT